MKHKQEIEEKLSKFHNEVIKPKLEKAWLDFVVFGYGREEIIFPDGKKEVFELRHPEKYYQKSPYKSPAEIAQLPDLKEIERIIKDLQERANPPVFLTEKQTEAIAENGINLIERSKNLN